MSTILARGREMRGRRARTQCQLSEAEKEANMERFAGKDSQTRCTLHTHPKLIQIIWFILHSCNIYPRKQTHQTQMPYFTYSMGGWHKHGCTEVCVSVSTAQNTNSVAFRISKNILSRRAGYIHGHTDSTEAVQEMRTQQSWLPGGVSRRWAEIRLHDCDCVSGRICSTPQQCSVHTLYTNTHTSFYMHSASPAAAYQNRKFRHRTWVHDKVLAWLF